MIANHEPIVKRLAIHHPKDMETLGSYIRERRLYLNLTQAEIGESVGIDKGYVSQIESGKIAFPNADLRRRLAAALGVRHIDLIIAAGELRPDEVPGPQPVPRNLNDPVERLCDLIRRVDLTVDRRQEGLDRILQGFLDQDRADGLVTEYLALEPREVG